MSEEVVWPAQPGCEIIYASTGNAGEYAPLSTNPYRGCGHRCLYCYVPLMLKMTRAEFDAGAHARKDFLKRLLRDAAVYQAAGVTEQVMASFTSDVYHPFDTSLTRDVWIALIEHGLGFCPLSKGGFRALRDIDLFRPTRDAYAATLTSTSEDFSRKWEPDAALPAERMATLRVFFERGIFTWVSLEPVLSLEDTLAVIRATHRYVSLYKVGRANRLGALTRNTDWREYTHRIIELLQKLGAAHYVKQDLQMYLPDGYHNPMRVQQHY